MSLITFVQISDDLYYLGIWQYARYFVTAWFKELALITIREMWGLESRSRTSWSRSRLLWQSLGLGLASRFEPGLGLGGCGLDCITAFSTQRHNKDYFLFNCGIFIKLSEYQILQSLKIIIWYKKLSFGARICSDLIGSFQNIWKKYLPTIFLDI